MLLQQKKAKASKETTKQQKAGDSGKGKGKGKGKK